MVKNRRLARMRQLVDQGEYFRYAARRSRARRHGGSVGRPDSG
jgi:hypothetical protein